jgi:hypothetical protein
MTRDIITSFDECAEEFDQIRDSIAKAHSIVEVLAHWVWDNVFAKDMIPPQMPPEVSDAITALDEELVAIARTSDDLKWFFCRKALHIFAKGDRLTKEEFYLLAAQGVMRIPSETGIGEAYEDYNYYFYEDDERQGYINPSARPDPPPVRTQDGRVTQILSTRIGIVPEDAKISFLNEKQKDFFKKYKPDLFFRFKKD